MQIDSTNTARDSDLCHKHIWQIVSRPFHCNSHRPNIFMSALSQGNGGNVILCDIWSKPYCSADKELNLGCRLFVFGLLSLVSKQNAVCCMQPHRVDMSTFITHIIIMITITKCAQLSSHAPTTKIPTYTYIHCSPICP